MSASSRAMSERLKKLEEEVGDIPRTVSGRHGKSKQEHEEEIAELSGALQTLTELNDDVRSLEREKYVDD